MRCGNVTTLDRRAPPLRAGAASSLVARPRPPPSTVLRDYSGLIRHSPMRPPHGSSEGVHPRVIMPAPPHPASRPAVAVGGGETSRAWDMCYRLAATRYILPRRVHHKNTPLSSHLLCKQASMSRSSISSGNFMLYLFSHGSSKTNR